MAKRGDFAVCIKNSYISVIGSAGHTATTITVGRVKSVSRDGVVKVVEPFSNSCAMYSRNWDSVDIIPAARITDKSGFEAECKRRQSTRPDDWNPWLDIAEVCRIARKYCY